MPGVVNMGIVCELMGNRKKAEKFYRNSIKIDNSYHIAHFRLAILLLGDKKENEALSELKLVIRYNPEFSPAYNEMGLIALENGEYAKALEHLKKAVSMDSTFAIAYYNIGGVLENMGEFSEAAQAYTNYLHHAETPYDSLEVLSRIKILMSASNR